MIVNKRITIDLLSTGKVDTVQTVQGDAYSRTVEIDLRQGRKPWAIPDGVSVMVEYVKPDGTKGLYDTLPDGTQAWSADGNILTIRIAPQMLTANGSVATQVSITKDNARLSLFKFWVYVNQKITGTESEDYINWRSAFIPQVENAKAGQYFEIEEVDSAGRAVKVRAVDAPQGGSGQADWNAAEGEPGFIANRTHWVEGEVASDMLTYDGNKEGRAGVDFDGDGAFDLIKVSDSTPSPEQLVGAKLVYSTPDGDIEEILSADMIIDESGTGMVYYLGSPNFEVGGFLIPQDISNEGMTFGKGIYFAHIEDPEMSFYLKSITATTPIFVSKTIHKLDNKFIDSEWMATYEEGIAPEITWDRSLDGREHYTYTEDYDDGAYATQAIVKMSDIVPSDEELKAATIEFVVRSPVDGGVASKAVADLWPLMESTDRITEKYIKVAYIEREDDGYTTLDLALVIKEETNASEIFDAPEIQAVLTPGVYFYDYKANSSIVSLEFYPKKLTVSGPGLAPIPVPEKFLPTTVPVIKTATPGQTIVVKSVDADGKPTEWEAVDLPDSDQNGVFEESETLLNIITEERITHAIVELEKATPYKLLFIRIGNVSGHTDNSTSTPNLSAIIRFGDSNSLDSGTIPNKIFIAKLKTTIAQNTTKTFNNIVVQITPTAAIVWGGASQANFSNIGLGPSDQIIQVFTGDFSEGIKKIGVGISSLYGTNTMEVGTTIEVIGVK